MAKRKGPRSPAARARVSLNAVRHGLRSTRVVIPGLEMQADWDQFFQDSIAALNPFGAIEYALAERITTLFWRLRRVARAERDAAIAGGSLVQDEAMPLAGRVQGMLTGVGRQLFPEDPRFEDAAAGPRDFRLPVLLPVPLELQNLSKYEFRLSRQLLHAMHELQALQDRREGRDAPLARVDVHGGPDEA